VKRVLIIAPSDVMRAGLESVVTASGFAVVGSSPDESAIDGSEDLQPDVVLLVLSRQTEEALAMITSLSSQLDSPLVVLTDGFDRSWAGAAVRSGARAILSSEATSAEIQAAVEAVSAGLVVLPPAVTDAVLSEPPDQASAIPLVDGQRLTPREIEILGMIAEGLGNKEIAWRLDISEHTVKFHIGSLFTKLGAQSRTEAVTIGIRQGHIML
jgi:two-component system, NarL family, response regulator YdfI